MIKFFVAYIHWLCAGGEELSWLLSIPSKEARSPTPRGPPPVLLDRLVDRKVKVGEKARFTVKGEEMFVLWCVFCLSGLLSHVCLFLSCLFVSYQSVSCQSVSCVCALLLSVYCGVMFCLFVCLCLF